MVSHTTNVLLIQTMLLQQYFYFYFHSKYFLWHFSSIKKCFFLISLRKTISSRSQIIVPFVYRLLSRYTVAGKVFLLLFILRFPFINVVFNLFRFFPSFLCYKICSKNTYHHQQQQQQQQQQQMTCYQSNIVTHNRKGNIGCLVLRNPVVSNNVVCMLNVCEKKYKIRKLYFQFGSRFVDERVGVEDKREGTRYACHYFLFSQYSLPISGAFKLCLDDIKSSSA